ncbi:MAG: hypothetical protein WKG00_32920 [Polyangiaceae bacterium]
MATSDTDPDTIPSQRGERLRSSQGPPVTPLAPHPVAAAVRPATPGATGRGGAAGAAPLRGRDDMDELDAEAPPDVDLLGPAERMAAAGLLAPERRGDTEDNTLVMTGRNSDPGEGVRTTPFIAPLRAHGHGHGATPAAFAPVAVSPQPFAARPSAPSLPGGDGAAAPVRAARLFFITFSIVLAIGMALLRWARPF